MNKAKKSISSVSHLIINILVMVFSVSCIFPVLWMINAALRDNSNFMANPLGLASTPHFSNFLDALKTGNLWHSFLTSGYLSLITVVVSVLFAFVVGFMVSRYRFRSSRMIYLLFLSGMVIPILSLMIPVFIEFKTLNLFDHWYTLLFPYVAFSMPLSVILMENFVKTIPVEIDEAAYLEGCGTLSVMFRIVFPLCRPIASVVVITSFISAWNEYPFSLILVSKEVYRTISIGIRFFGQEHTFNYTLYFAALVVSITPILILYLILSKFIVQGMTMGAVKG
jgi:raffinose/stachyose/melibiose transport system permease protein